MSKTKTDAGAAAADLRTIRDFFRYAITSFNAAGLGYGHGTDNARDEAAFLILEALHLPIDELNPYLDARLTAAERRRLAKLIDARVTTRKPAPYLVNKAYIQGHDFYVDERVIVPRSYLGEILAAPELVGDPGALIIEDRYAVRRVLDLCTGSGCLAILAALAFPEAEIEAVDISADALEVARINVADYGLEDRITLRQGDVYGPVKGRFDVILANPPYVDAEAMAELPPEFRAEPELALAGGADGLAVIRRIVEGADRHLSAGGGLLCEIGTDKPAFEAAYPELEALWIDTEESSGEVFWAEKAILRKIAPGRSPG
jgi:ribosomal protein L3 glutamine methyltransferase